MELLAIINISHTASICNWRKYFLRTIKGDDRYLL